MEKGENNKKGNRGRDWEAPARLAESGLAVTKQTTFARGSNSESQVTQNERRNPAKPKVERCLLPLTLLSPHIASAWVVGPSPASHPRNLGSERW